MRVAITGGTGFVGRHLARNLVERGHEPVLIARNKDLTGQVRLQHGFLPFRLIRSEGASTRLFELPRRCSLRGHQSRNWRADI